MKCIKCGKEIKAEFNNCPYCGQNLQMVPDYSIYDEEDINVIIEESNEVQSRNNRANIEKEARKKEARDRERARKSAEAKKKQQMKLTILIVAAICTALLAIAIVAKIMIDNNNNNSYDYQMKQADSAMFRGEIDKAEEYYLKALQLSRDDVDVRLELADLYLQKEDTESAIKYLKEVLTYESQNFTAYKLLFDLYTEAGDTAAIMELKNAATDSKVLNLFSDYAVDAPALSMAGGTYSEELSITISAKKDVEVYYTLNGDNPVDAGQIYKGTIKLEEAGMHTVKAVAKNELGVYSAVVTETYVIEFQAPADPVVTPDGGEFTAETYVYISVPSGCSAYYVWSNTNEVPTEESTLYVSPIKIPEGRNILSVIIIDDKTGLSSGIYRNVFEYTVETEDTTVEEDTTMEEDTTVGEE